MAFSEHSADPDAGLSYNEGSNAIQKLLDKLQKRPKQGGMMPVLGKQYKPEFPVALSSLLDGLVEFADVNPNVVESVWRRLNKVKPGTFKQSGITIPKDELLEEHEHLIKVLKNKKPGSLNRERMKQAKELREYRKTKAMSAWIDNLIQFASDPRPRNNLGEFAPQNTEGPDPNAMFKTYRIAPNQPGIEPNKNPSNVTNINVGGGGGGGGKPGILGAAGLTVLGGAGGVIGGHFGKMAIDKVGAAIARAKKLRK